MVGVGMIFRVASAVIKELDRGISGTNTFRYKAPRCHWNWRPAEWATSPLTKTGLPVRRVRELWADGAAVPVEWFRHTSGPWQGCDLRSVKNGEWIFYWKPAVCNWSQWWQEAGLYRNTHAHGHSSSLKGIRVGIQMYVILQYKAFLWRFLKMFFSYICLYGCGQCFLINGVIQKYIQNSL